MRHPAVLGGVAAAILVLVLALAAHSWSSAYDAASDSTPSAVTNSQAGDVNYSAVTYPRLGRVTRRKGAPVWSVDELAAHTGLDPTKPLLLVCLGEIYDVGPGKHFYGPGAGSYNAFAGRDASRAFSTGEFSKKATSRVDDLEPAQVAEILRWCDFYREHGTYYFVGYLNERYYDEHGRATPARDEVDRLGAVAQELEREQERLNKQYRSCNSRDEGGKPWFEVWCDDSYHGAGTRPFHFYSTTAAGGAEKRHQSDRCVCVTTEVFEKASASNGPRPAGTLGHRFVAYPDCEAPRQRCRRTKTSKPPRDPWLP